MDTQKTVTLYRPTGEVELKLVEDANWESWPARLPEQPIFYPVLNRKYAQIIARDWNAKIEGRGYVTQFLVNKEYLDQYEIQQVGGKDILEYWIPAEELEEFNRHIVGKITVVDTYSRTV